MYNKSDIVLMKDGSICIITGMSDSKNYYDMSCIKWSFIRWISICASLILCKISIDEIIYTADMSGVIVDVDINWISYKAKVI